VSPASAVEFTSLVAEVEGATFHGHDDVRDGKFYRWGSYRSEADALSALT
jgi:hypothetical protein